MILRKNDKFYMKKIKKWNVSNIIEGIGIFLSIITLMSTIMINKSNSKIENQNENLSMNIKPKLISDSITSSKSLNLTNSKSLNDVHRIKLHVSFGPKINSGTVKYAFIVSVDNRKMNYRKINIQQHEGKISPLNQVYTYSFPPESREDALSFFFVFIDKNNNELTKFYFVRPVIKVFGRISLIDETDNKEKTVDGPMHRIFVNNGRWADKGLSNSNKKNWFVVDMGDVLDSEKFNKRILNILKDNHSIKLKTEINSERVLEEHREIVSYLKDNNFIQ